MAITIDARELGARAGPRVGGTATGAERQRAFRQAHRHSLLVRALRVALPVGVAGLVGFYVLTLGVSWRLGSGHLNVGEVVLTPDDMTMKGPSYFGVTKDGGRYEVRAKRAVVTFSKDAPVKLIDIDGDLVQANGVVTTLKAKHGTLDNAKSQLELYDGIEISATNGLKARLSRATIYSKEHRVVSRHPVDVEMPTGRVRGNGMVMRTNTRETTVVGNVKAHLVAASQPGQQEQAAVLGRDARQPVDVDADQLYVNDAARTAQFTGNVVAVQGDSTLRAPELHVSYEGRTADQLTAAPQQGAEAARLSRLVARNGAEVAIGTDRRVTSTQVEFDAKADTALFTGDVVVTQQSNVLRGRRLLVDRKSGRSRLDAPPDGRQPVGRIAATFHQGEAAAGAQPRPRAAKAGDTAAAAVQSSVLGTFRTDPSAPIEIEADTLDVNDHSKEAVFRGNVKSQQGDFIVRTVEMVAHYTGQAGPGLARAGEEGAAGRPSQLTRVEARQKVLITSKDGQSATGDWADFDVKANTVLMGNRVVVSRGKDVAEGPRLKIDLNTGMYRFELEQDAVAGTAPAVSATPALGAPAPASAANPAGRACPPGKQCLLFYPKEAQEKAKEAVKKLQPGKDDGSWPARSSASPPQRGN